MNRLSDEEIAMKLYQTQETEQWAISSGNIAYKDIKHILTEARKGMWTDDDMKQAYQEGATEAIAKHNRPIGEWKSKEHWLEQYRKEREDGKG